MQDRLRPQARLAGLGVTGDAGGQRVGGGLEGPSVVTSAGNPRRPLAS